MYKLSLETQLSSAHSIPEHKGKCRNPHGHNYRVVLTFAFDDMAQCRERLAALPRTVDERLARFDHVNLNDLPDFSACSTTAENLSRVLYETLAGATGGPERLRQVNVFETAKYSAAYTPAG